MPSPPDRKPDAAIVPAGWGGPAADAYKVKLGPVLGRPFVVVANQSTFNFCYGVEHHPSRCPEKVATAHGHDQSRAYSILFPWGHSRAGEERYDWYAADTTDPKAWKPVGEALRSFADHGGRVAIGFLKGEDPAASEAEAGAVKAEAEKALDRIARQVNFSPASAEIRAVNNPIEVAGNPA